MHPQDPWCRVEIEPREEATGGGDVAELWKTNFLRQKLAGGAFATFWTTLVFAMTFFANKLGDICLIFMQFGVQKVC